MKIKAGYLFILLWMLFSCQREQNQIVIEGNLSGATSHKIYLSLLTPDGLFPKDSAKITDGKFKFKIKPESKQEKGSLPDPAFYQIALSNENYIVTLARPGEKLNLTANTNDLVRSYTITGGEDARFMWELDHSLALFIDSVDRLYDRYLNYLYDDSVKIIVENHYNHLVAHHAENLVRFIRNHSGSLASVIAFYQKYNRLIFLNETENLSLLKEIYAGLSQLYPANENVVYLGRRIEILEKNINRERKLP